MGDRKAKAESDIQARIEEATARFQAAQALDELKRRYPSEPARCPDCGSFEHFEC